MGEFGSVHSGSPTGTLLSNSMIRNLNFCCGDVTSTQSSKPPDTFVWIEAWQDVLGCLTSSPTHPSHPLLPNSFYQLFDNSQLPGFTDAWSSILANTLRLYVSSDIDCNYTLCDAINTENVKNCKSDPILWHKCRWFWPAGVSNAQIPPRIDMSNSHL